MGRLTEPMVWVAETWRDLTHKQIVFSKQMQKSPFKKYFGHYFQLHPEIQLMVNFAVLILLLILSCGLIYLTYVLCKCVLCRSKKHVAAQKKNQ